MSISVYVSAERIIDYVLIKVDKITRAYIRIDFNIRIFSSELKSMGRSRI